jgi:death-on-curing protein
VARLTYLDRQDVEFIVHRLAAELFRGYSDPLPAFQLRDDGTLLESALGIIRQPYYRTLFDKAGALLRSMIKNHPLVDGNKRVGISTAFDFLLLNQQVLVASNEEMVRFALEVARSEPDRPWQEIGAWLKQRTVRLTTPDETARRMMLVLPQEWQDKSRLSARLREYQSALMALGDT